MAVREWTDAQLCVLPKDGISGIISVQYIQQWSDAHRSVCIVRRFVIISAQYIIWAGVIGIINSDLSQKMLINEDRNHLCYARF